MNVGDVVVPVSDPGCRREVAEVHASKPWIRVRHTATRGRVVTSHWLDAAGWRRYAWTLALYRVVLRRKFVAGYKTAHPTVYPAGSVQLAWQDRHGFVWLRGIESGWEFATVSKPGVDFDWADGVDPRPEDERARAREIAAVYGPGETR